MMGVTVKQEASVTYRVARVEVKEGDAIDQIKFVYSDKSVWIMGHEGGGKVNNRPAIMTEGEFLVKVTHERLNNLRCAASSVEFKTNKGRVFGYYPSKTSTKWKSEQTTLTAEPGKEIIGLKIKRGVLEGISQQDVPREELGKNYEKEWVAIVKLYQKEDRTMSYQHFHTWGKAKKEWKEVVTECNKKPGRSAVLLNCMTLTKEKQVGTAQDVEVCLSEAKSAGLYAEKMDKSPSITETVIMLYKVLNNSKDFCMLFFVMVLLGISFLMDLELQMLTGLVISMATSEAFNTTNLESNWYVSTSCGMISCEEGHHVDLRLRLLLSMVIVGLTERLFYVTNVYFHHNACDKKNHQMQVSSFRHILSLDQSYFDTHCESEIKSFRSGVSALNNLITWNIPYMVGLSLQMVLTGVYMLRINLHLGCFAILGFAVIQRFILKPFSKVEESVHKVHRKLSILDGQILDDVLQMITTVKLFSKEKFHCQDYEESHVRSMNNINQIVVLRCIREFLDGFLCIGIFGVVTYLALVVIEGASFQAGDMAAFFLLLTSFRDIFHSIKWHNDVLVREFGDIERYLELQKTKSQIQNGSIMLDECKGEIEFENVNFEYPARPGEKVLKNLSMKINPNKITAVVGDSGAGKSTIAKMVLRLYDPTSGVIKLDGYDIRDLDIENLHQHVGIVNQNPALFNTTLGDNIAYGAVEKTIDEEKIKEASNIAECGFISKFRGGFDTYAGSGGASLSGGQKQRIAIARAAIRKLSVLILDEATSSLDTENEVLVQEAIEKIMKGRTTLIIAHRLSTIKNADEIIVMKDGRVAEKGTHQSLMDVAGVYYNLVSAQLIEDEKNKKI